MYVLLCPKAGGERAEEEKVTDEGAQQSMSTVEKLKILSPFFSWIWSQYSMNITFYNIDFICFCQVFLNRLAKRQYLVSISY